MVQRVREASVHVDDALVGSIGPGFLILLGITHDDTEAQAAWLAQKIAGLRVFTDEAGKMNHSLIDRGYGALVVSQVTLYGDCRKGRRPSFVGAARPEQAEPLYQSFCGQLEAAGVSRVPTGVFGAMMDVRLLNDGPVTLILDTP